MVWLYPLVLQVWDQVAWKTMQRLSDGHEFQ